MMRLYLLGAGASYGYDSTLPHILVPPNTTEFFSKGFEWGFLTDVRYPNLVNRLKEEFDWHGTNEEEDIKKIKIDIEPFLAKISQEFEDKKNTRETGSILGQTAYFILDLLKRYTITGQNSYDCYRRLALSYLNNPYFVITLNYDILFESAVKAVGLNYCYTDPIPPRTIPITKIHGSISWLNPCGKMLAVTYLKPGDIKTASTFLYSNTWSIGTPIHLSVDLVPNLRDFDMVQSQVYWYEPIIVPPQGEFKDFRKFKLLEKIGEWAKDLVRLCDELVIIGCSLRDDDTRLWEMITSMKEDTKVILVNPSARHLKKKILKRYKKLRIYKFYNNFEEFCKTL